MAGGRKLGDRPCVQNCSDRYYRGRPEPAADPFRPGGSGHDDDLAGLVVVLSILVKQISALFVTIKSLFAL